MPDDHKPASYRLKLGPVVTAVLEALTDQSAAALDDRVEALLASERDAQSLRKERELFRSQIGSLGDHLGDMAAALVTSSTSIDNLAHMVDHRTREIQKLMLHISTLVGTTMTEGAERERLHTRMNEIFNDLGKQMEALATLVKDQQRARQLQVQSATARAEEERLSIAKQNETDLEQRAAKSRGMER